MNSETTEISGDPTDQLAISVLQTVNILSSIVTLIEKNFEGSHSRFVSEKSATIAEAMGFSETEIFEIKTAGLLHDIGKIGFKDSILLKFTNEMTKSEFSQYMMHPTVGMNLLKEYFAFENVAEIVYQHHERIDGSGFPRHLQMNSIHPGAKIIAVVDTFHNMVYKSSRNKLDSVTPIIKYTSATAFIDSTKDRYAAAMNYITQKSGTLFDKDVVEKFSDLIYIERRNIGKRTVMRILIDKVEPGMIFAESYYTSYGLLIASKGEKIEASMIKHLKRLAESGDIPEKILVMK